MMFTNPKIRTGTENIMERLKQALEDLDEVIFVLEDKIAFDAATRRDASKRQGDIARQNRLREVEVLAISQKIAARLDNTIEHVERILSH